MSEKLFAITETQLTDVLNLLAEIPFKYAEYPHLILQNLMPLDKETLKNLLGDKEMTDKQPDEKELLEG